MLAGLLAAFAALIVIFTLTNRPAEVTQQTVVTSTTPVPVRQVVIAATDISANTVITNAQLTSAEYPAALVPADAITSTERVLGSTTRVNIFSGQIVLQRQFIAAQGRTGASVSIPPGKVLVAFPATDMLNSTGAVQAGDHVDIMLTIPISGTTRVDAGAGPGSQLSPGKQAIVSQGTLQNVEVYSIGFWNPSGQQAQAAQTNAQNTLKVISFVVDHQEALILKFVKDSGGTIDLAVRSVADSQTAQTDPVTLDYLVDLYGFIGLPKPKP